MDDFDIGQEVMNFLGIKPQEGSAMDEKVGEARLGSINALTSMGPSLILGSIVFMLILLITVVTIVISQKVKKSEKCQSRVTKLKLIVFYNPIIRYFVLNSLKLSICAAVALRDQDGEDSAYVYPFMILTVINVIPVVFFLVAYCKRDKLDEEATRKSIGAIYLGKNITKNDHKAHVYPMIFFWRRSLFVIVTVCLFDQPTLQMIAHYLLTMLTVTALLADSTAFDS